MADFIPRAQLPQQQVQGGQGPRNTVRVDDSGGQAMARAIGGVGDAVAAYAKQKAEQENMAVQLGARKQLSDWENTTFDPENKDGISKYKGENALGANEALIPELDKRIADIGSKMTPRQRIQFEGVAQSFRDGISSRLNGYMDREHSAATKLKVEAGIGSIASDAATAGMNGDFDRQEVLLGELEAANSARFAADGVSEDVAAASNRAFRSSVRRQTIESMMTADPNKANERLELWRDQLLPEDRQRVEGLIQPILTDARGSELFASFMAGGAAERTPDVVFGPDGNEVKIGSDMPEPVRAAIAAQVRSGKEVDLSKLPDVERSAVQPSAPRTLSGAIDYSKSIQNPVERAAFVSKAREHFALVDLKEREENEAWSERVNAAMQAGDPSRSLPQILGAADYQKAVAEGKVEALESLRLHKIQGTFVQDDLPFKEAISREAVTNFEAFMKRDFNDPKVQARLATDTLGRFKSMQVEAKKAMADGRNGGGSKQKEWATESQLLGIAYSSMGLTGAHNAKKRDEFETSYLREKREFNERHNGRNPDANEMQAIINGLKLPMVRSTWFGLSSEESKLYGTRSEDGFKVPAKVRPEIIKGLQEAGIKNPTEGQIVEAYKRGAGDEL